MISLNSTRHKIVRSLAKYREKAVTFFILTVVTVVSLNGQTLQETRSSAAEIEKAADDSSNYWEKESLRSAVKLYRKSSVEWMKAENFQKATDSLLEAGRLLLILGDNDLAVKTLTEAYKIADSQNLTAEKSKSESSLSLAFQKIGNVGESKKHLDAALDFNQKSDDKAARALAYFASAEYLYLQHKYDDSLSDYIQSANLWKEIGGRRRYAETCIYAAYTFFAVGKLAQGLDYATEAKQTFSAIGNQRGISLSQIAIGHIMSSLNRKQEALEHYSEANRSFPDDLDFLEKGALLNGFGAIYENYGDFESSLKYRLGALEVFKKDNYLSGQLATMHSIISLSFRLDKAEAAESFVREAERLSKILHDNYYITLIYRAIGDNFFERKQDAKAKSFYLRSLANKDGIGSRTNYILIHNKLGRIHLRSNRTNLAEKHFNLSLAESIRLKNYFVQADNYFYLAQLEPTLKINEKSLEFAKRSVEISNKLDSDVLSSKLKQIYFSGIYSRYELYINLLMKSREQTATDDFVVQALQAAEKSRARSMLENLALAEANFIKDASPETVRREKEIRVLLNSKADKLTDLLSSSADKTATDQLDNEINELEHELEEIKANFKRNSPLYSAIKNPAPFDVGEFQRNVLDENSVLLEFSFGRDESYLWLVGKTEVTAYVLPPREQIESSIEKLRRLIDSRQPLTGETVEDYQARIAAAETEFETEAADFSRTLLGQVAGKIAGKRLIIVPDGKLNYFPIAALPFPGSVDNTPILLTNETIYEPSAATLALLMRNGGETAAPKNLLVFSDPIFSKQDARTAAGGGRENEIASADVSQSAGKFRFAESLTSLVRLNATKDEADAIIGIVGESGSTALSGAAATRESALEASVADYKIIHFATHGLIDEDRPELSGIVLSQFDENGRTRNGVVRLQDIYGMNLSADAVVLSACSTGIGKEIKGEGLMSLNNAFLQTGAKTVVASLWKVDDYAAQELMKHFYRELTSGTLTTAEALRKAQIELRRNPQFQSPFYWAAFTVEGDFQNVPRLSKSFDYRIYGFLIFPFALIGLVVYRRRLSLFNRKTVGKI